MPMTCAAAFRVQKVPSPATRDPREHFAPSRIPYPSPMVSSKGAVAQGPAAGSCTWLPHHALRPKLVSKVPLFAAPALSLLLAWQGQLTQLETLQTGRLSVALIQPHRNPLLTVSRRGLSTYSLKVLLTKLATPMRPFRCSHYHPVPLIAVSMASPLFTNS